MLSFCFGAVRAQTTKSAISQALALLENEGSCMSLQHMMRLAMLAVDREIETYGAVGE
jgi:hypothetical protein